MTSPSLEETAALGERAAAAPLAPAGQFRLRVANSETIKAAGLAVAAMSGNLVAVIATVVFSRMLGASGYGALAALLNFGVILFVPGSAMQVSAAREGTLGRLGSGGELAATLSRWTRHITVALVTLTILVIPLRAEIAALLNVREVWGAASVPITGVLWLLVSVQRGLLQAQRAYRVVGVSVVLEAICRLAMGLLFVGLNLGVTGAYLGTTMSLVLTALILNHVLHRRLGPPNHNATPHPLRALIRDAAFPIGALVLVATLQNVDVIMAKHVLDEHSAGVYAAATVAAKALVWIAIGVGFWVLPEVTRRAATGRDPRTILFLALGVIGGLGAGALTIFAVVPTLLMKTAFGKDYVDGATVLFTLGAAYTALSATYLGVQFFLGLRRRAFIIGLTMAAVAEPIVLARVHGLADFSQLVLIVEALAAGLLLGLACFVRRPRTPLQLDDALAPIAKAHQPEYSSID